MFVLAFCIISCLTPLPNETDTNTNTTEPLELWKQRLIDKGIIAQ
jgi:hypothetical protein